MSKPDGLVKMRAEGEEVVLNTQVKDGLPTVLEESPALTLGHSSPKHVRVFLPQGAITVNLMKPNTPVLSQGHERPVFLASQTFTENSN